MKKNKKNNSKKNLSGSETQHAQGKKEEKIKNFAAVSDFPEIS